MGSLFCVFSLSGPIMNIFFEKNAHNLKVNDALLSSSPGEGIKVIGAGLPRTGTLSLKTALTQLYSGKCYHMMDVFAGDQEDVDVWVKAAKGEMKQEDWREFFSKKNYVTGVDFPFSLFYQDIMEAYPDAKVVLSTRDASTWYDSVYNSIWQINVQNKKHPTIPLLLAFLDGRNPTPFVMHKAIGDRVPSGCDMGFEAAIENGPKTAEKFFKDWEAEVRRVVPEEKLLVASAKEGWAPLCKFLDLPIPDNDYPRVNDTASIKKMLRNVWMLNALVFYILPTSIAVGAYIFRGELAPVIETVYNYVLECKDLVVGRFLK